jgi:hypothetical protein
LQQASDRFTMGLRGELAQLRLSGFKGIALRAESGIA